MEIRKFETKATLAPSKGNPRNSEGAFIKLKSGELVYAYSRYCGESWHDDAECNICVIRSNDGGMTWNAENFETVVRASEYGVKNVMSASLAEMHNGDIGLFYLIKYDDGTTSYNLRRYRGNFNCFVSESVCVPKTAGSYFVVNNDRVLRLANGRLIVPVACHRVLELDESFIGCDSRASDFFVISDDDGETWFRLRGEINMSDGYSYSGLQEPGIIELPNRVLYAYARTDRMYQYESVSLDGGKSWFGPRPSRFSSPCGPMQIKRNPFSGKYYAFWTPTPNYTLRQDDFFTNGRNPFVVAESDNGIDFGEPAILESDTSRGYCYCGVHFTDEKNMIISYFNGGAGAHALTQTVIKHLTVE